MKKPIQYLLLLILTFVLGYVFLRTAYFKTENIPFAREIILIILGTIATIIITSALLNKQSEIELEKEQRVKIFEIKSSLYFELINFIEKIIIESEITPKDIIYLNFLTHKISIIANLEVLEEFTKFVKTVKEISIDTKVTPLESKELSEKLNQLCIKIRYDLIIKEHLAETEIQNIIKNTNT